MPKQPRTIETVRDLMQVLIDYCPDTKVCITTPDRQDPGWNDCVIGAIEYDDYNMLDFQAINRPD